MTTTLGSPPAVTGQDERRERLGVMKRRATAFLGVATAIFAATAIWGGESTAAGYVLATAEAAMVGGLADWFAVTALFRHPLGIPIPHTAIIVERKDQFAATLGEFIQDTFLTPEAVMERIHTAQVVPRLAAWLRDPENATRVAGEVLDGAVQVADLVSDDDVRRVLQRAIRTRVDAFEVAPTAGRALEVLIKDGRHQQALDVGLRELDNYIESHQGELREQLGGASPWWLPGAAEDRIFDRLVNGARSIIAAMLEDSHHHLRLRFEERVAELAQELRTSPDYRARGEQLKHELLDQPEVSAWVGSVWEDAKGALRRQAGDPDSDLHKRMAELICSLGARLEDDPSLSGKLDDGIETAVTYVIDHFHGEIVGLVTSTVERWDAEETADRLELLLGPDLQFIRINGTVVGALAGLVLHTVAELL